MIPRSEISPLGLIFALSGVFFAATVVTTVLVGNALAMAPLIGAVFLALGLLGARLAPGIAPSCAAVALMGQAIALTAALDGRPWQLDAHMVFFALLACLVVLRDIKALLVATALVAVHHLSLALLLPALVYPGGGSLAGYLGRTVFHAVIVLIETAALVYAVIRLNAMERGMADQNAALESSLAEATTAKAQAQKAQQDAVRQKEAAEGSTAEVEKLLGEAKAAAQAQEDATREREAMRAEQARREQAKSAEREAVVDMLSAALAALQRGDLTVRVPQAVPEGYESIRDTFNASLAGLEAMVGEVSHQSNAIEAEIRGIAAAAESLANRTQTQAATLREASGDLTGITERTQQSNAALEEARGSAHRAEENAQSSGHVVAEAADVMQVMQGRSAEIAKIVDLIDDISFQTNLLALNAGVEAARAGEAGRGFSVVASEVRGLAQRSSESAKGIRALIERSGQEVQTGTEKISETVAALGQVRAAVSAITGQTEEISVSARAQSADIEALNQRLSGLDQTTQENAAMFEQTSAACSSLMQGADALRRLTDQFQVGGQATAQVPRVA
ncbi:MAG: methyl-accepting chemotaxis protein [Pseudomonadota bacterium]